MSFMIAAAGALGALGAIAKGSQQSSAYEYDANVQDTYAQEQIQQGKMAAGIDARKAYLLRGTILANQGGSGGTNSGSALDVLADQMSQGMLQEQGDIYSSQVEGNKYRNSATADRYNAREARSASYLNAASALVGAGAQEEMYGRMKAQPTGSGDPSEIGGSGVSVSNEVPLNYYGSQ